MKHIISLNTSGSTSLISTRFCGGGEKEVKWRSSGRHSLCNFFCYQSGTDMPVKQDWVNSRFIWNASCLGEVTLPVDVGGCWANWKQAAQQAWEWEQATRTTDDMMEASPPYDQEICVFSNRLEQTRHYDKYIAFFLHKSRQNKITKKKKTACR